MSKHLYGIISRNVTQEGNSEDKAYDEHDPVFDEEGSPQIYLAERVETGSGMSKTVSFHLYVFDGQQWVPETGLPPLDESEVKLSVFGKWKFNAQHIAMSDEIFSNAITRACVLLSKKIVVCMDNAIDFRILNVVRPFPDGLNLTVAIPDAANPTTVVQKAITCDMIVKTDQTQKLNDTATVDTPDVKHAIGQFMAHRGKTPNPFPKGAVSPKTAPKPQPVKTSPRPTATFPPQGQRKMQPPTPLRGAPFAHPSRPKPNPGHAEAAPGKRVDYKFESQGQTFTFSGLFYEDANNNLGVAWDNGNDSGWPPTWDPPIDRVVSTRIYDDPDTEDYHGTDGRMPGMDTQTFDVFLAESFLRAIDNGESPMTLQNTAVLALQAESKIRPYYETASMAKARDLMFKYLTECGEDDMTDSQVEYFRGLHWMYVCQWAKQQGMREEDLETERESRMKGRTHINRQSIAKIRDKTSRYANSGRGGWTRSRRGGYGRGGYGRGAHNLSSVQCYTCGQSGHYATNCPTRQGQQQDDGKGPDDSKGPAVNADFRMGRGGNRARGCRRY